MQSKDEHMFRAADGSAIKFVMSPCDEKAQLKELIQSRGGELSSRPHPDAIRISVPGVLVREEGAISSKFIRDCVQRNKLLDMNRYKVRSGDVSVTEHVSFDDSDMQHARVVVRLHAKDMKGRNKYFYADDMILLRYLLDEHLYTQVRGRKIWTDIEKREILPGRTWHSLKDRYLKKILPDIKSYGLKPHEVAKLTNTLVTPSMSASDTEIARPKYKGYVEPPASDKRANRSASEAAAHVKEKAPQPSTSIDRNTQYKPSTSSDRNTQYKPLQFVLTNSPSRKTTATKSKVDKKDHAKDSESGGENENYQNRNSKAGGMSTEDSTTENTAKSKVPNTDTGVRHLGQVSPTKRITKPKVVLDITDVSGAAKDPSATVAVGSAQTQSLHNDMDLRETHPKSNKDKTQASVMSPPNVMSPPAGTESKAQGQREQLNISPFSSLSSTHDWNILNVDEFDKFLVRESKIVLSPIQSSNQLPHSDKAGEPNEPPGKRNQRALSVDERNSEEEETVEKRTTRSEYSKASAKPKENPESRTGTSRKVSSQERAEDKSERKSSRELEQRVKSSDKDELSEDDIFSTTSKSRRSRITDEEFEKQPLPSKRKRSVSSEPDTDKSGRSLRSRKRSAVGGNSPSSPAVKVKRKKSTVDSDIQRNTAPPSRVRDASHDDTRDAVSETSSKCLRSRTVLSNKDHDENSNKTTKSGHKQMKRSVLSDDETERKKLGDKELGCENPDEQSQLPRVSDPESPQHPTTRSHQGVDVTSEKEAKYCEKDNRNITEKSRSKGYRKERRDSEKCDASIDEESQCLLSGKPVNAGGTPARSGDKDKSEDQGKTRTNKPENPEQGGDGERPGTSGLSKQNTTPSPERSKANNNASKSSTGEKSLHDFLMLATMPSQSQTSQDDLNDSQASEFSAAQITEAHDTMKALCGMFSVSMDRVYALVYWASGSIRDVHHYLKHGSTPSGTRLWTEKDDDLLQHGNEAEYLTLERLYGEQSVLTRQQFLASFLRSREAN